MKIRNRFLIALLIVYILGLVFFSIFTYPKTSVNGRPIGLTHKDTFLTSFSDNSSLHIYGRNGKSALLQGDDIDFKQVVIPGQSLDQNIFLWPYEVFQDHNHQIEYDFSYDQDLFYEFLMESELTDRMTPPQDAYITESDGSFEIVEEQEGDTLDMEAVEESIITALSNGESQLNLGDDDYLQAEVTSDSDSLRQALDNASQLVSTKITFDMGDELEEIEGSDLLNFYTHHEASYAPIRDIAHEYVRQLAIEYDTFYPDDQEREFTTSAGEDIIVVGGIYGWQMNVDATTDLFMEALEEQMDATIVPIYQEEGLTRGKDDLDDTYIEVSLDKQHLWFYKDGELITETDVVTGDPTLGVETSKGVGKIWSKETDRSLVGIVPQSSADYDSHVDYWMPINWNDEGIHNSTWRREFGSNIYLGNGSYGCINLPLEPTKKIFENVELNTPVVVY